MAFWYLLILIVSLIGVRLRREGFFPDFLGKEQCKAVVLPISAIRGLAGEKWVCANPHVFIGICFMVTVGIALLYNKYLRLKIV